MKGLLLKDFLVLTKQLKFFLIWVVIMAIFSGSTMASIAILAGAMLPMTAMAYDERAKWNDLAVMMPYSRKNMILSKYLLGYLCMAGAALLFMTVQFIITTIQYKDFGGNLDMVMFAVVSGLLLIAIHTPLSFKYGMQKGGFVSFIFMGVFIALVSMIRDQIPSIPEKMISLLPIMIVFAVVVLNVISVFISLHLKKS